MIILGIDPGTVKLGWCLYDSDEKKIVKSGTLDAKKMRVNGDLAFLIRLIDEFNRFWYANPKRYWPQLAMIERTFVGIGTMSSPLLVVTTDILITELSKWTTVKTIVNRSWRKKVFGHAKEKKEFYITKIREMYEKDFSNDEAEAVGIAMAGVYEDKTKMRLL